jgi:hypothetical protein
MFASGLVNLDRLARSSVPDYGVDDYRWIGVFTFAIASSHLIICATISFIVSAPYVAKFLVWLFPRYERLIVGEINTQACFFVLFQSLFLTSFL